MSGTIHAGEERIECVVKDLSSTGAGLVLPIGTIIAGAIELELHSGDLIPAEVSWRSGPRCGLRFHKPVVFSAELPEPPPQVDVPERKGWLSSLLGRRARR